MSPVKKELQPMREWGGVAASFNWMAADRLVTGLLSLALMEKKNAQMDKKQVVSQYLRSFRVIRR